MSLVDDIARYIGTYNSYTETVFRSGLGLVMLGAGVHGMIAPEVWASYMAPWAAGLLSSIGIDPMLFMQVNAVGEIVFGLALLADFYTTITAGLTALALFSILINLFTAGAAGYADIIVRDIGLLFLAIGVTLQSARDK